MSLTMGSGHRARNHVHSGACTILLNTTPIVDEGWRGLLRGAIETFNLSGDTRHCYYLHPTGEAADSSAMQNDWEIWGGDLGVVLSRVVGSGRG